MCQQLAHLLRGTVHALCLLTAVLLHNARGLRHVILTLLLVQLWLARLSKIVCGDRSRPKASNQGRECRRTSHHYHQQARARSPHAATRTTSLPKPSPASGQCLGGCSMADARHLRAAVADSRLLELTMQLLMSDFHVVVVASLALRARRSPPQNRHAERHWP